MIFTIDVNKDWLDCTWGWAGVIGAILVPVLIWFFGASRFEGNKIKKEKQDSLNYLLTSTYRYFQYFLDLKQMVIDKQNAMLQFINNPTEENKIMAFSISTPPAVDFDITPNKYAFTIAKEDLIVDIIFHFLQVLSDVNGTLEYVNHDMMKIFDVDVPIETFIRIAQGNVSNNIPGLIFKINMGLFMLFRLMEIVKDYNKYLDKKYQLMPIFVPNNIINAIQSIRMEITMFIGRKDWEEPFMKMEIKNEKTNKEKPTEHKNYHIKDRLLKILIMLLVTGLTIFLYVKSVPINFFKTLAGITIGCLFPLLFDETKTVLVMLKNIKERLNPVRYERTFALYNERLFNFASQFYFFLSNISTLEKKRILSGAINGDLSVKKISSALKEFLKHGQPDFQRILVNGKSTFNDISCNHFTLAEGEMSDIYRILKTLPQELDFTIKRYPEFINMQSGFHQVGSTLKNMPDSKACEAFTECLIQDIINVLDI